MKTIIIVFIVTFLLIGCAMCKDSTRREAKEKEEIFAIVNGVVYRNFTECANNEECLEGYEEAHGVLADAAGMARD